MKIECSPVTQAIVARFAKSHSMSEDDACFFLAQLGSSTLLVRTKQLKRKTSLFFPKRVLPPRQGRTK